MPRWASIAGLRALAGWCWRRVATWQFWLWVLVLVVAALLVRAFIWSLVSLPNLMAPAQGDERFAQVNEARKTVAQIVGGVVLLLAGLSTAWLTLRRVNALERQVALAAEGQVTDRLSRGIEQLGATSDSAPIPEIRAGAVFTLERVAKESEASFEPVFQILMGYLRTHSPHSEDTGDAGRDSLRMDVEAALSALERLAPLTQRQATIALPRVHMPGASFNRIDLVEANLRGANLSGANLSRTKLNGANLSGADLSWADLGSADLSDTRLVRTDLRGADLSGADLSSAYLIEANLGGAEMRGANLDGARLTRADLHTANLTEANVTGGNVREANLTDAILSKANLSGAILSKAILSNANLSGADLGEANLDGANLNGANLRNVNLNRANLSGDLSWADLRGADLRGADLTGADLTGADLRQVEWDSATRWPAGFDPPPSAPRHT